ncbi:phage tail family protein [Terribacillus saccharophilus]|uniref:phage tail family protein n=1 Tax=Terribacillus saccharophilus TaxID=361277 RepID=UPI003D280F9D
MTQEFDQLDIFIETLDGAKYALSDFRITVKDFVIDSPEPIHTQVTRDGYNGFIDAGTTFAGRTMRADLYYSAYDEYDFLLRRNMVFRVFDSQEPFYLYESRLPDRRWLVKLASKYSVERQRIYGFFQVEFVSPSPYAESIGLPSDDITFDGTWEFGMGIPLGDFSYDHSHGAFSIWNLGDVTIDSRNYTENLTPLTIQCIGSSNNLTITNRTTGDLWRYNGTTTESDVITIEGDRSRKNGVSIYGKTNRARLRLAPGENLINVSGTLGRFRTIWDFRFLYI